jgi:ATP-dependent protease ClpP protease subunit
MREPRYRFRGNVAPPGNLLQAPPRGEMLTADVDGGVATLRLYDPIDSWGGWWGVSAKEFTQALDELGAVDQIDLHINSPGGEVWEAVAILNSLRAHPAKVVAHVDGIAASAASFLAAGADELVMGRNTELMIHDAWGIGIGPAAAMRDLADLLDKLSDDIASIYADKAGGTVGAWRGHMIAETWYSASEAVEAGLADRVDGAADSTASNRFDLSLFNYAGRRAAPDPAPVRDSADPPVLDGPYSPDALDRVARAYASRYRLPV